VISTVESSVRQPPRAAAATPASLSGLGKATLIRACAELPDPDAGPATTAAAVVHTLRLLPRRIGQLTTEARDLHQRMTSVIDAHAPSCSTGSGSARTTPAALLIAAGDNPERLRSDASFAPLCGVSIERSLATLAAHGH